MGSEKRRKNIPLAVKLEVALRHLGFKESEINWDHDPPLALRAWDPEKSDTVPAANDPEYIQILPVAEHKSKTTGRKGESKLNALHGDVAEIAKLRRLTDEHREFQRRLLTKGDEVEQPEVPVKKSRWPSRPFSSGGKRAVVEKGASKRGSGFG